MKWVYRICAIMPVYFAYQMAHPLRKQPDGHWVQVTGSTEELITGFLAGSILAAIIIGLALGIRFVVRRLRG